MVASDHRTTLARNKRTVHRWTCRMIKPRAEASLRIQLREHGPIIDLKAVRLLEMIDSHGSIRNAAAALGISYRTAWITVDKLNGLGQGACVHASRGGSENGSRLSPTGKALVDHFRRTERELQEFIDRLNRDSEQSG